jgi:hypothetical protein
LVRYVVWDRQWELASCFCTHIGSFCPRSEPIGIDELSCISLMCPT